MCFQNCACGEEILAKTRSCECFGRAQKINLVNQEKSRKIFRNDFENTPPRENPGSAPGEHLSQLQQKHGAKTESFSGFHCSDH